MSEMNDPKEALALARASREPVAPLRIYLAARYSRRLELCGYRDKLQTMGHWVDARWLDGHHEINYDDQAARDALHEVKRQQFATEDLTDLLAAECLIAFTEEPRKTTTRGGRHVEFGIALALGKRVIVVGPKENVFYSLPGIEHFLDWESCARGIAE